VPRILVLGCGTGVGKTRISVALLRALGGAQRAALGLKPVETGVSVNANGLAPRSDAQALSQVSSSLLAINQPLYAFKEPVSPHLAARAAGVEIAIPAIVDWVRSAEQSMTRLVSSYMAAWTVIETAGGVFSPLSERATNFDLALALEPTTWIVVAPDALGVLHDVSATLQAMRARGREPEHVVLSAAREPDASTGSNARELHTLGIVTPSATLRRDDDSGIDVLVHRLLDER
jgi:dethiobiotin synthetase